jgi:hypothetical protein
MKRKQKIKPRKAFNPSHLLWAEKGFSLRLGPVGRFKVAVVLVSILDERGDGIAASKKESSPGLD